MVDATKNRSKSKSFIRGLVIAVLAGTFIVFAGGFAMGWMSNTKPDNLGIRDGSLAPCPESPNCVSSQTDVPEKKVDSISFDDLGVQSAEDAKSKLESVIGEFPRTSIITNEADYLHFEFRSMIFRFVDDLEVQIDAGTQVVHFRSASRVGHSDMGANRSRVEAILKKLRTE